MVLRSGRSGRKSAGRRTGSSSFVDHNGQVEIIGSNLLQRRDKPTIVR